MHNWKKALAGVVIASGLLWVSPSIATTGDLIVLLDIESTVTDRYATKRKLLSEILDEKVSNCDSRQFTKPNRYYRCVKKKIRVLRQRRLITKDERTELIDIVNLVKAGETEPPAPILATVNVRVTEPDGTPVIGADVSLADSDTNLGTTNVDGLLSFSKIEENSSVVLRFSSVDYAEQIVPVSTIAGEQTIDLEITMMRTEEVQLTIVDGVATGTSSDGASVMFVADSFVTPSGQLVDNENISVTITYVDVANAAEAPAFPGSYTGNDGSDVVTIASLGTAQYTFSSINSAGSSIPLDLATNATAMISIPISFDTRPDTGESVVENSTIPLWSLNETTGIWLQEGEGTVVESATSPSGFALEGQVSHFSWWNIDVPVATGLMSVAVSAPANGTATITAIPNATGWRIATSSVTVGGTSQATVPANVEICYSAVISYFDGQKGSTNTVCTSVVSGGTQDIQLAALGIDAPLQLNEVTQSVSGFIGTPIQRISISPLSLENDVVYSVAGGLPAGLQLVQKSATSVEIVGVPTDDGVFDVQVTGTNVENETDSVNVQYDISSGAAPVSTLNGLILVRLERNTLDLNTLISVPATNWEVIGPVLIREGMELDSASGVITIPFSLLFRFPTSYWSWNGRVRATFEGGSEVEYDLNIFSSCTPLIPDNNCR